MTTVPPLPTLSWRWRTVEKLAWGLGRAGLPAFRVDGGRILAAAGDMLRRNGLEASCLEALRATLQAIDPDRYLNLFGRRQLQFLVREALEHRLWVHRDLQAHPEILDLPVARPVLVMGLPRSGTTLMQTLLLQHPGCRWLRPWELEAPFPESPTHWNGERDPRRRRHEATVARLRQRHPELEAYNPLDSPAECWPLLWSSFLCHTVFLQFGCDGYPDWLRVLTPDTLRRVYAYYRVQLQHLSWYEGGCHWVLKAPEHTPNLAFLLEQFPDARIIQMHRDPARMLPSLCSLAWHHQYPLLKDCRPQAVGRQILTLLQIWSQRALATRQALPTGRVCDLYYQDLARTPLAAVEALYEKFNMPLPAAMRAGISRWLDERHGAPRPHHHYSLTQFGLTLAEVERAFADYRDHFHISKETGA